MQPQPSLPDTAEARTAATGEGMSDGEQEGTALYYGVTSDILSLSCQKPQTNQQHHHATLTVLTRRCSFQVGVHQGVVRQALQEEDR